MNRRLFDVLVIVLAHVPSFSTCTMTTVWSVSTDAKWLISATNARRSASRSAGENIESTGLAMPPS